MSVNGLLRLGDGSVYGVTVHDEVLRPPVNGYSIVVDLTCDPNRVSELREDVEVMASFLRVVRMSKSIRNAIREATADPDTHSEWLAMIMAAHMSGEPLETIDSSLTFSKRLTSGAIRRAARRYLSPFRRVEIVLLPLGSTGTYDPSANGS